MVESKSEITTRTGSTEVTNLYEVATQNWIRILDELAKAQPKHIQSISNLQQDYVVAAKNTIENMVSVQKMLANNVNFPIVTPQYADEFVKRSN
jgi:hydroxymethylglutaryl-CoA reductase